MNFSLRHRSIIWHTVLGQQFAATDMTPQPPIAIIGKVWASSPERTSNSFGFFASILPTWIRLPLASFIPTTPGSSLAILTLVSADMLLAVLPGTLYITIGTSTDSLTTL